VTAELEAAGVDVIGNVVRGEPINVIENAISDVGADIVVMPSHTAPVSSASCSAASPKRLCASPRSVVTVPMVDREEEAEDAEDGSDTEEGSDTEDAGDDPDTE